jgi:hypothetical protein
VEHLVRNPPAKNVRELEGFLVEAVKEIEDGDEELWPPKCKPSTSDV